MLTATMPALSRALDGQLPPQVIKAVMQALGNCGQDAVQRGGVAVMPDTLRGVSGVSGPQGWNPYTTPNINNNGSWIPYNINGDTFVDMPSGGGYRAGDWYSTNYGSPTYMFFNPTSVEQNFLGGNPTNFFGGTSSFENVFATNLTAGNVTNLEDVRLGIIKLQQTGGPPGDDGSNGSDGNRGPSGPPGDDGMLAGAGFIPKMPVRRYFAIDRLFQTRPVFNLVTDVEFDPDTCELTISRVRPNLVTRVTVAKEQLQYYGPAQ